jgi:hypothetical protein
MKALNYILPLFATLALFTACEKDITVDLPEPEIVPVIEGYIFQGERPYVIITKNSAYFAPIDSASLAEAFISDAVVTVTDGILIDTLTLTTLPEYPLGFGYASDSPVIIGEAGKTYTLTVTALGKTITSSTTIVPPVTIDSTNWIVDAPNLDDSLGLVWMYYKDPGTDERGYRIFSRRVSANPDRNEPYFRPNFEFWNRFSKGQNMLAGVGRAAQYGAGLLPEGESGNDPDGGRYRFGDTVQVRLCTTDLPYFLFLNSLSNSVGSSGSPFAAPNNVQSNVLGGALGGWGGYGVSEFTIICNF